MTKSEKTVLWVIIALVALSNPIFLVLAIIGLVVYYQNKDKIKKHKDKMNGYKKNEDIYNPIDTNAEVISSTIVNEDEWKATKEYKK